MVPDAPAEMTAEDRSAVLGTGGVGVLSLSTDGSDAPHAVPVSYGFDPVEEVFYFRLSTRPGSTKGEVDGRSASVVVHGDDGDGHWSVVARGTLVSTDEASVSNESLAGLDRVNIPLVDAFDAPIEEITFAFVRLDPDSLTGLRVD
ncbi:pyridoxamine 5'-phosphate oxidase family protein [Salinarchaeum laminariae]|uniref:pyridoxamine 5'-phosphate oxidase family protein n=1 Tax=Salinarchaeum laminariae TaxID=869888 RepID=UPI0020C080C1|nr:pyridoxamine 5'-phosphate oxidase family protein [Salinarchaeum laminariae]